MWVLYIIVYVELIFEVGEARPKSLPSVMSPNQWPNETRVVAKESIFRGNSSVLLDDLGSTFFSPFSALLA